jgi:large subunit ribosomal protein L6
MSRIGKMPVNLPNNVQVRVDTGNGEVTIKGPKGELKMRVHPAVNLQQENNVIRVVPVDAGDKSAGKYHGLVRSLVNNMVIGVSEGFKKELSLVGVGYRAAIKGKELSLTLGYSHPVVHQIPEGIEVKVDRQTEVIVSGADKELVGQVSADIRAYRKPEPYHGKGIRYKDERIITKVGKAAGKK